MGSVIIGSYDVAGTGNAHTFLAFVDSAGNVVAEVHGQPEGGDQADASANSGCIWI